LTIISDPPPPVPLSPICDCLNFRIQQVDGGFFEKFGNLFREHAELVENRETEEKEKVAEIAARIRADESIDSEELILAADADAEVKSLASDLEEEKDKSELISAAFNVSKNAITDRSRRFVFCKHEWEQEMGDGGVNSDPTRRVIIILNK
jgi:hypothetical protein